MTIDQFVEELGADVEVCRKHSDVNNPLWEMRWGGYLRISGGLCCPITYLYCRKHPEDSAGNHHPARYEHCAKGLGLSDRDACKIVACADGNNKRTEELNRIRAGLVKACGLMEEEVA